MAKNRKTVSIDALLDYANGYLSSDYEGGDSESAISRRTGVIHMLEAALREADRWRGYSFLDEKQITKSKPGIRWLEGQSPAHTFHETDETRRRYA